VVATATHPDRPAVGYGYVGTAVERAGRPVWVTGGASPSSVGDIVAAGGRHVVVVRWLTEAAHPKDAARALRDALDEALLRA
jgi:thiamine-phosphate pyrophosphorylase